MTHIFFPGRSEVKRSNICSLPPASTSLTYTTFRFLVPRHRPTRERWNLSDDSPSLVFLSEALADNFFLRLWKKYPNRRQTANTNKNPPRLESPSISATTRSGIANTMAIKIGTRILAPTENSSVNSSFVWDNPILALKRTLFTRNSANNPKTETISSLINDADWENSASALYAVPKIKTATMIQHHPEAKWRMT